MTAKIGISVEGTNVQLHQTGVTLGSNTKYQLSFDAYCTSGHDLSVSLVQNVSPYTNYGLSSMAFDLGTGWQHYTVTFTTSALGGTVTDGRLIINLRAEAAPDVLGTVVREGLVAAAMNFPTMQATLDHLEHFRPGKPTPTHRIENLPA